eukprot:Nitzschia sp. Nitz4//scaffold50_size126154//53704//55117//NITZ4_003682-RA/size126154-augustus-gene-0.114-mRNA-1//1//CDS//3329553689//1097//frame0
MMMKLGLTFVVSSLLSLLASAEYQAFTPHSSVVALDESSFDMALQDPLNPVWFLKFYAPWCGHCKRLAPVLDKVAPKLKGKLAIGTIDCTIHKPLCNKYNVRGFPTLKYVVDNGEVMEYPGGRSEAAIMAFGKKMSSPVLHSAKTYEDAMAYVAEQTTEGVAFLAYDPTHTADLPSKLYQTFRTVARQKQASAYFVWLEEDPRDYPFVHRIESGIRPRSYEDHDVDLDSMTTDSLASWVQSQNVPLVVEFGPENFSRISKSGRRLAMSVVDFTQEDQKAAIKEHMMEYAKSLTFKQADKYYFGVMDGKRWSGFLEQYSIDPAHNPQMLVLDVPNKNYWQNHTYNNMVEFMGAIKSGDIPVRKASTSKRKGVMGKLESLFLDNFPYSLIVVVLLVFGLVFMLIPSPDDMTPPYDRAPEEGEVIPDDDEGNDQQQPAASETKKDK